MNCSELLNTPVSELALSCRAANCLRNDNILCVGDLVQKSERELLRTPNFGKKSLKELKERLGEYGLYLDMEAPAPLPSETKVPSEACIREIMCSYDARLTAIERGLGQLADRIATLEAMGPQDFVVTVKRRLRYPT